MKGTTYKQTQQNRKKQAGNHTNTQHNRKNDPWLWNILTHGRDLYTKNNERNDSPLWDNTDLRIEGQNHLQMDNKYMYTSAQTGPQAKKTGTTIQKHNSFFHTIILNTLWRPYRKEHVAWYEVEMLIKGETCKKFYGRKCWTYHCWTTGIFQ
jgi:hypothetical protein